MKRRLTAATSWLVALVFAAGTLAAVPLVYAGSDHGRHGNGGGDARGGGHGQIGKNSPGANPARSDQKVRHDRSGGKGGYADKGRSDAPSRSDSHGRYDHSVRFDRRPSSSRLARYNEHRPHGGHGYHGRPVHVPSHWQRPTVIHVVPRYRSYHGVTIIRPYGHPYAGFAFFTHDSDAWKWLAFTAITLKILDNINEEQQRRHEQAQLEATTAPIGETIYWNDGSASGSVTATRDGRSTSGRYCREFRQQIKVGDRTEQAYGTACQQPDGSWEIVSSQH